MSIMKTITNLSFTRLCPMLNGTMGTKPGGDDSTGAYGES